MPSSKSRIDTSYRSYQETLQTILQSIPPVIVLEGPEEYLRREAIGRILTALETRYAPLDTVTFHGPASRQEPPLPLEDLLNELRGRSLFAPSKVVVLRQADRVFFSSSDGGEEEERGPRGRSRLEEDFCAWVKAPDEGIWFLVEFEKLNRQRIIGKTLASSATVLFCPTITKQQDVIHWLRETVEGYGKRLEARAAELLFLAQGGNLGLLHAEVEKLVLYVGEASEIRTQDVEALLAGTIEFDVFSLTNALERRDLSQALWYARRISTQGLRDQGGKRTDAIGSVHRALFMVAQSLEGILAAKVILAQGGTSAEVASTTGTSPWRAEKLSEAARRFSLPELRRMIADLANWIHSTHDTDADPALMLERAVLAICRSSY